MLPIILFPWSMVKSFLESLNLPLSRSQRHELGRVVEGSLVTRGPKTLTALSRQLVEPRNFCAVADLSRKSPWDVESVCVLLLRHQMGGTCGLAATLAPALRLPFISIDDSITHKPLSGRYFEQVDRHGDHTEHTGGVGETDRRCTTVV